MKKKPIKGFATYDIATGWGFRVDIFKHGKRYPILVEDHSCQDSLASGHTLSIWARRTAKMAFEKHGIEGSIQRLLDMCDEERDQVKKERLK